MVRLTIKKLAGVLLALYCAAAAAAQGERVAVVYQHATPQALYAARKLSAALAERGFTVQTERTGDEREAIAL